MESFVTVVKEVYEWSVDRVDILKQSKKIEDALALSQEFREWIDADYDDEEEVMVIEKLCEDDYFYHIND